VRALSILAGKPLPDGKLTPSRKKKALDDAMDVSPEDLDEPVIKSLANLAGIPMPRARLSSGAKKKAADDALEWLRNNNPRTWLDSRYLTES
jgi:hypothetical protein